MPPNRPSALSPSLSGWVLLGLAQGSSGHSRQLKAKAESLTGLEEELESVVAMHPGALEGGSPSGVTLTGEFPTDGGNQALKEVEVSSKEMDVKGLRNGANPLHTRYTTVLAIGGTFLMAAAISYGAAYWSAIHAMFR
jgi:hypothetical protein